MDPDRVSETFNQIMKDKGFRMMSCDSCAEGPSSIMVPLDRIITMPGPGGRDAAEFFALCCPSCGYTRMYSTRPVSLLNSKPKGSNDRGG